MKLQPLDLKQGEDFGYSVAACDITGDGRDDLIVGSPSYAEDQFHYNVGRLHVFVFDTRQNNLIDKRFVCSSIFPYIHKTCLVYLEIQLI